MKLFKYVGIISLFLLMVLPLSVQTALADKSAVAITAPETAAKGSEVTVKLSVTHNSNNLFHYTNWVTLKGNNKELTRWEFSSSKRPEAETFTREYKIIVNEPVELTAQANCNIHGSQGPVIWKIVVK